MATLEEMFGKTDAMPPAQRQRAIEAGINTPEDFGGRSAKVAPTGPLYKPGSSAPQDAAAARGLTVEQLRAIQDAKLQELLKKRKAAGYAGGGAVPRRDNRAALRAAELAKLYAPELKASPTLPEWMTDIGRGVGAAVTEGFPHAIGNLHNELHGLPTVSSKFKQQPGVFQDEIENSWPKAIAENVFDPSNLVGLEFAQPVARALPAMLTAGAAGYSPDAEAGKVGALGRIARRLSGPAERKLSVVRDVPLHASGPAVSAKSYEASDLGALMDALAPYVKPRMLKKPDGDSIFGQAIDNISDPDGPADALTTVLFGADGTPQAYHQVSPKGGAMSDADYLAFLGSISGQKGAGEQALRHSLDNSSGEMSFYPTPGAKPFYDKMMTRIPGMRKVQGDGNNVDSMAWSRESKAVGGMVGALGRIAKNMSGEPVKKGVANIIKERGGQWSVAQRH